ncbi:MAG: transcription factor, partial [Euryarchaeota archaeon]|nr:transcription factor [Euryarchaeota archaeon]
SPLESMDNAMLVEAMERRIAELQRELNVDIEA